MLTWEPGNLKDINSLQFWTIFVKPVTHELPLVTSPHATVTHELPRELLPPEFPGKINKFLLICNLKDINSLQFYLSGLTFNS